MSKRTILIALVTLSLVAGASALATRATASRSHATSRSMLVGIFDDPMTLGRPDKGFPLLKGLRPMLQDIEDTGWILLPAVQPALAAMARHGLRFDALLKPRHLFLAAAVPYAALHEVRQQSASGLMIEASSPSQTTSL